ncbi:MAG: tetratricopeptide repeat protein [Halioglobus sp.]
MFRIFILTAISTLLLACASTEPVEATAPVTEALPEEAIEPPEKPIPPDSVYPLLLAEFAMRRRSFDVALENYIEQSRKLDDPGVRSHTTHLAQFMQREAETLEAVQLWIEVEPDNVEANNTLATLLSRQGRSVEALPHLAVVGRSGAQPQYPILLNGFRKLDTSQQSELVAGINELSTEFPSDNQLLLTQALIHEELGQNSLALDKLELIFQRDPYQQQAVLMEAKLLVDSGAKKPFTRIEAALEARPDDKRLRLQYARLLTRSDMDAARAQFEIMSSQSPRDGDLLFSLALINRETGDTIAAKAHLRQMLALEQRVNEAHFYLGRIAEEEKDFKTAVSEYMKVEDSNDFLSANSRIGRIMVSANQAGQFHSYMVGLRLKNPKRRALLYALEVDLLAKAGNLDASMAVLNQALAEFPDSTSLRYTRSMLGEQQDNLQLMESDLRAIIDQEPENATALNALGYSLANRTQRYEEAHELISRALALQPDEPAILDSMGWVLFHKGSYEEALEYLTRAYIKLPDPEVAAHLGEVLWVTGETDAAMEIWRGALLKDPDHKILVATLKRLGVTVPGEPN